MATCEIFVGGKSFGERDGSSGAKISEKEGNALTDNEGLYVNTDNKMDASKFVVSNIDIGEGAELPTGTFYFVYE